MLTQLKKWHKINQKSVIQSVLCDNLYIVIRPCSVPHTRYNWIKEVCIHTYMSHMHHDKDTLLLIWHYKIWSGPLWCPHKTSVYTSHLYHMKQNMHSMGPTRSLHSLWANQYQLFCRISYFITHYNKNKIKFNVINDLKLPQVYNETRLYD